MHAIRTERSILTTISHGGVAIGRSSRIDETGPRFPSHILLMTFFTVLYLAVTLAFRAHLLDSAGYTTTHQLESTLTWTTVLAGTAIMLTLLDAVMLPVVKDLPWTVWKRRAILSLSIAIGVAVLSWIGQIGISWGIDHSDGISRRAAAQSYAITQALLDSGPPLNGLNISREVLASPQGKSLAAVVPLLVFSGGETASDMLENALQTIVAARRGTAAQQYDNIFVPSVRSVKQAYDTYVAAQSKLKDEVTAIADREKRAPNTRLASLARRNADLAYADRVRNIVGEALPPGLDWDRFYNHPLVQHRWRAAVNAPATTQLSPAMRLDMYTDRVYKPMVERIIQPYLDNLLKPARDFQTRESMDRVGHAAMLWLVVPAIALSTTLAGILWHVAKIISYLNLFAGPRWRFLRRSAITAPSLLICLLALNSQNAIAQSPSLRILEGNLRGPVWLMARISAGGEPLLYLLGNTIRKVALAGYDFGYDPFAERNHAEGSPLSQLIPR